MAERNEREGAGRRKLAVGFVLADHFTLSAFSLFVDHLRLAADESDLSRPIRCEWFVMSARTTPIRASCGVTLAPTAGLIDPGQLDYVVVIGGLLHAGRQVDAETTAYLRAAARAGVVLVGVCTGSFILARAGLLDGRRVCVSWLHYQDFLREFPDHPPEADQLFLVDGDRITCAGGRGAADLATYVVERHLGRAAAQKSRQVLLLDQTRGAADTQPHPPMAHDVADARVRRALLLMEQHLADPLPIGTIAARLDVSPRQLERLFQGVLGERPAALYRSLRLRYALWLLDNTSWSVTAIALESGFSDCAHFSRQFKALHGVTPSGRRPAESRGDLAGHRVFD